MVLARLLDLGAMPPGTLSQEALRMARLSFFDWMVCGLAGRDQPVARILREKVIGEQAAPQACLFGGGAAAARGAAFVNGAPSHALDYDDTHFAVSATLRLRSFPLRWRWRWRNGAICPPLV